MKIIKSKYYKINKNRYIQRKNKIILTEKYVQKIFTHIIK